MSLTAQEICSAIVTGDLTNEEINKVVSAIKFAREQLARSARNSFKKGMMVKFEGRKGVTVKGKIIKIGPKYIRVEEGMMIWRVSPNMLSAA